MSNSFHLIRHMPRSAKRGGEERFGKFSDAPPPLFCLIPHVATQERQKSFKSSSAAAAGGRRRGEERASDCFFPLIRGKTFFSLLLLVIVCVPFSASPVFSINPPFPLSLPGELTKREAGERGRRRFSSSRLTRLREKTNFRRLPYCTLFYRCFVPNSLLSSSLLSFQLTFAVPVFPIASSSPSCSAVQLFAVDPFVEICDCRFMEVVRVVLVQAGGVLGRKVAVEDLSLHNFSE